MDKARPVALELRLERLGTLFRRIGSTFIDNFLGKYPYFEIFRNTFWAIEVPISPVNKARRVVLGTVLERSGMLCRRIQRGITWKRCVLHRRKEWYVICFVFFFSILCLSASLSLCFASFLFPSSLSIFYIVFIREISFLIPYRSFSVCVLIAMAIIDEVSYPFDSWMAMINAFIF